MMRKYYIIVFTLLFVLFSNAVLGLNSDQQTIFISREIQVAVEQANQKQELIIPSDPLDFATTLTWEVSIPKKPALTSEKAPAGLTIEEIGKTSAKPIERKTATASGTLSIPKGVQYKVILNAGEYSGLLNKYGLAAKLKLHFAEAMVKYSLSDQPYLLEMEILGPDGLTDWTWLWEGDAPGTGAKVSHQFSGGGKTPIVIEGKGKTASGVTSRKFWLELDVPELVTLNPNVEPLTGPAELDVKARVNAVVNYGQRVTYTWNFENGAEMTGPEAHYVYQNSGRYQVTLTARAGSAASGGSAVSRGEYTYQKTWLVEVNPLTVLSNATVSPALGPVPLQVTGSVKPTISGGPTKLVYLWDIAGETETKTEFKRTFTEPGDYRILLKITDELHPDLVIPEDVILVKALPPQISLKATGSVLKGSTPLTVKFDPGISVSGAPVDLVFHWDFGDGETSAEEKPTHTYKKAGPYQARVVVSDRLHSGNLVESVIPVEAQAPQMVLKATPSVASGLLPLKVNFSAQVSITGSPCEPLYFWDFGDGEISGEQNPVHIYRQSGKYAATLVVKDRFHSNNEVKEAFQIEVKIPELRVTASMTPASGKAPHAVKCKAEGIETSDDKTIKNPNLKYLWDFGDGTTAEGPTPTHTYEKAGIYNASVTVLDEIAGVSARKTFKITVR